MKENSSTDQSFGMLHVADAPFLGHKQRCLCAVQVSRDLIQPLHQLAARHMAASRHTLHRELGQTASLTDVVAHILQLDRKVEIWNMNGVLIARTNKKIS